MTGLNSIVLTLLALTCLTSLAEGNRALRWWNPITWLREKEDHRLAASVSEFFSNFKQEGEDNEDSEGGEGEGDDKKKKKELIEQLDGNRVKILNDTIISDYIFIEYWQFDPEYDVNPSEEPGEPGDDEKDATEQKPTPQVQQDDGDESQEQQEQPEGEPEDQAEENADQDTDKMSNDSFESGVEQLYFVLVESRDDPANDPLIIWLQGGPGCSSMLGLYTENGPFNFKFEREHIKDPFKFEPNDYSWNNHANVMYVDQPIGTGFSFVDSFGMLRWSEKAIASDFSTFLHNFMYKYPEYKERPLYITGESYAGHYIPNIARHLQLNYDPWINLQGVAIGNGWVDPFYQYPAYPRFAAEHNLISFGHSLVLRFGYSICQFALIFHVPVITNTYCSMIGMTIVSPGLPDFNVYDIREPCERMGLCYPDDHLWQMLNTYEYRDAMHLPIFEGALWEECATLPHLTLMFDFNSSWGYYLAPLLDAGLPVLIYNGDQDYICNWEGGNDWTQALVWDGQQEFIDEKLHEWQSPTLFTAGGSVRNFENFTFMRVYQAGHMVPTDQPEIAYDMITEFIKTKKITGNMNEQQEDGSDSQPSVPEEQKESSE